MTVTTKTARDGKFVDDTPGHDSLYNPNSAATRPVSTALFRAA